MPAALGTITTLCAVCRRWGDALVCAACCLRHEAPADPRCPRCALRLSRGSSVCSDCSRGAPPQQRTVCATDYAFPWDRLLLELKFGGQVELARPLALLLRREIEALSAARPTLLLPVPLSPQRLRERGYNQAWLLTRRLAAGLGITARADLLQRLVDTPQQSGLDRAARLANLRAAFGVAAAHRGVLAGRAVALVDDVMTTGATAAACASTLLAAGAASVDVWAVARTPAA